jgi:hypothetical protein
MRDADLRERRRAQLREAKRAQRRRERRAGIAPVQLRLPRELGAKLLSASRQPGFNADLERFLDEALINVADYPGLRSIMWSRRDARIPAREAFQLYERNWRFIDVARLSAAERALIDRLVARYGGGLLNA